MKKYNFNYLYALILLFTFSACDQKEIDVFNYDNAVYFKDSLYSYSFLENPGSKNQTIKLPVVISGKLSNEKREFKVELVNDQTTTAKSEMYKIHSGIVEAGEAVGYVPLELNYDTRLDNEIYKVKLEILPSDDFPEIRLNQTHMTVSFTNQLVEPANWVWIKSYLGGQYSTAWYRFILSAINMSSFPYYPGHADKKTWWMSYNDMMIYVAVVRYEFEKFNMNNPPLTHDDGEWAKLPVKSF